MFVSVLASLMLQQAPTDFERYLTAATRLLEATEYEQALKQLEKAKSLTRSPQDEVRVHLLEGVVNGELGRLEKAKASFRAGLALDVSAELPVKVSRRLKELFEGARVEMAKVAPVVLPQPAVTTPPTPPTPRSAELVEAPVAAPPPRSRVLPTVLGLGALVLVGFSATAFGISRSRAAAVPGAFYDDDARRLATTANTWATVSLGSLLAALVPGAIAAILFVAPP